MGKLLIILFILFAGFILASMMRTPLEIVVNIARTATPAGDTFALALLGTFLMLPVVWVFVRAFNELRRKDD
jgi:fluoride ion exporter CrcB/FEX